MIRIKKSELGLLNPSIPLPTVEFDMDQAEEISPGPYSTTIKALAELAEKCPTLIATIYTFEGASINFHEPSWSQFLIVAGPEMVLHTLYAAFSSKAHIPVRYSDHISANQAKCSYHIEMGKVWEPEDAINWFSKSLSEINSSIDAVYGNKKDEIATIEDQGVIYDDEDVSVENTQNGIANLDQHRQHNEHPVRYRSARSDASVGSIRKRIETAFGLPEGSVVLCGPDRKALRADARISTLRRRWE